MLIALHEQVFAWRYLSAKQKIYPPRLRGENSISDNRDDIGLSRERNLAVFITPEMIN
jgi:hypothetical protein